MIIKLCFYAAGVAAALSGIQISLPVQETWDIIPSTSMLHCGDCNTRMSCGGTGANISDIKVITEFSFQQSSNTLDRWCSYGVQINWFVIVLENSESFPISSNSPFSWKAKLRNSDLHQHCGLLRVVSVLNGLSNPLTLESWNVRDLRPELESLINFGSILLFKS